jgi:hypothetical protein
VWRWWTKQRRKCCEGGWLGVRVWVRCEGVIRGGASDRGYVGLWVLVLPLWFGVILVDGYRCALCVVAGAVKVRREVDIEIGGWMF